MSAFQRHPAQIVQPSLVRLLFYAGPLSIDTVDECFKNGFPAKAGPEFDPLGLNIYGNGFYFSSSAAAAHLYVNAAKTNSAWIQCVRCHCVCMLMLQAWWRHGAILDMRGGAWNGA